MIEVLVALVGAVGLVGAALANRGRQHAKAAREQVQNSHGPNLREELDERHAENVAKLNKLVEWQGDHETKSARRDARIARVEVLLVPAILTAAFTAVAPMIRKR